MIKALILHKENQEKIIRQLGDAYNNQDFIFAKTEWRPGYPIVIKTAQLKMARLLALANLNLELTPHSLRHTHTSLLAEVGVALEQEQIMDRLGHSDVQITKHVYLHVTKEMNKEASQKFLQLMRSL
ncbi:Phage integrase family protein [Psychrobacillus sp. OK032]|nr:Phage integrase family protein [Psychrobacillus sp. OK032]